MAISVNPLTHVISVPKADLTLVQSSPEVRTLDLNAFRLWLKDWEDDEEGIPQLKTHNHNTEVTLSGLVYARIVEVLAPYTVEFEDGQYTINCVGANHNLADVRVPNQVSLIVNNAAGLISNANIEHASFNGYVLIDVVNGFSGTLYPTGTQQRPVNNLDDAMLIAGVRGFDTFMIRGDLTVNSGGDYTDYNFIGASPTKTAITIDPAANVTNCEFETAHVLGTLDGGSTLRSCLITDLNYVDGYLEQCVIGNGTITLSGVNPAYILDCRSGVPGTDTPTIDLGGSGSALNVRNYNGGLTLTNKTGNDKVSVDLNSGQLVLDNTVTVSAQDEVEVRGVGLLVNEAVNPEYVQSDGLISTQYVTEATWQVVYVDVDNGTAGTAYPLGTQGSPVDNIADAKTIAERYGMRMFKVHGNIALSTSLADYVFEGDSPSCCVIDLNNQDVDGASFLGVTITGQQNGSIQADKCALGALVNMEGRYWDCTFGGDISVRAGKKALCYRCPSAAGIQLTLDLNGSGIFTDWGGMSWWNITNMTDAASVVAIMGNTGVTIDNTNTAGAIYISGDARIDSNLGAGVTVSHAYRNASQVWDSYLVDHLVAGTFGKEVATKADVRAASSTTYVQATSGTVVYGSETNDYTYAVSRDGTYWQVTEDAVDGLTAEIVFNLPSAEHQPGTFRVFGRYEGSPGNSHYLELWVYNYESSGWELLVTPFLPGGVTSDDEFEHEYYERHVDRDNSNEVKLRLIHHTPAVFNAGHNMYIDYAEVSAVTNVSASGIADAVWDEDLTTHSPEGSAANMMKRILGLVQENFWVTDQVYDAEGNLLSATIKTYTDAVSVGTANNVLATYELTAAYSGGQCTLYQVKKV